MTWELSSRIVLAGEKVPVQDSDRQMTTAREILRRLSTQPGLVLADEVGMGKTFVALAVAASVVEHSKFRDQVVVMVPAAVADKWPKDWEYFVQKCWSGPELRATSTTIGRSSDFLKLLDDPESRRHHIIFLKHGALTSTLTDPWVQLAILRRAFQWQRDLGAQRKAFPRWAARLLRNKSFTPQSVEKLFSTPTDQWMRVWNAGHSMQLDDDPVPDAVLRTLKLVDYGPLRRALTRLPLNNSAAIDARLKDVRASLEIAFKDLWADCLHSLDVKLPLLILDEAHHLKNSHTQLASLFSPEAKAGAESLGSAGALSEIFDRMLFLTATPFQLGHRELVNVLTRFRATRISDKARATFESELQAVGAALDAAQLSSLRLDRTWQRVEQADVADLDENWWNGRHSDVAPAVESVLDALDETRAAIRAAELALKPWVIRHIKSARDQRRNYKSGAAVADASPGVGGGLPIGGASVLPFLLAARAQAVAAQEGLQAQRAARFLYADGLASSFEAYAGTRRDVDSDDEADDAIAATSDPIRLRESNEVQWYLDQIASALPKEDFASWGDHPKVHATVDRAVQLWREGEKTLVFCFYIATGKALRSHISRAVRAEVVRMAVKVDSSLRRLPADDVFLKLEDRGTNLLRADSRAARAVDEIVRDRLGATLAPADVSSAVDVVTRFLRTPSFLVRYVDFASDDSVAAVRAAFAKSDGSQLSLIDRVSSFGEFLKGSLELERGRVLETLTSIPTGNITASDLDPSERSDRESLLPNVRLANGGVRRDTRQRLMLGFNSPFFPEILVASSVMSEGVDLHLDCRHVIHHDLDWNPSTLEQRTGRLDRIGSKGSKSKMPIVVYEPYLAGTQDERVFRVVKDRERWFNVVMGEVIDTSEIGVERLANRVLLPRKLAEELTMNLAVYRSPIS